jgi:hypothetical protein
MSRTADDSQSQQPPPVPLPVPVPVPLPVPRPVPQQPADPSVSATSMTGAIPVEVAITVEAVHLKLPTPEGDVPVVLSQTACPYLLTAVQEGEEKAEAEKEAMEEHKQELSMVRAAEDEAKVHSEEQAKQPHLATTNEQQAQLLRQQLRPVEEYARIGRTLTRQSDPLSSGLDEEEEEVSELFSNER